MASDLTTAQLRLSAARAKQRRLALGPPLDQTDANLGAISTVSEHDMPAVEAFCRDAAGALAVDLLRASRGA